MIGAERSKWNRNITKGGLYPTYLSLLHSVPLLQLYLFKTPWLTAGHDTTEKLVHSCSWTVVPFCLVVTCICGQNPDVFVRHHSPQDAQLQLFNMLVLIVWHITGRTSKPELNALQVWGCTVEKIKLYQFLNYTYAQNKSKYFFELGVCTLKWYCSIHPSISLAFSVSR